MGDHRLSLSSRSNSDGMLFATLPEFYCIFPPVDVRIYLSQPWFSQDQVKSLEFCEVKSGMVLVGADPETLMWKDLCAVLFMAVGQLDCVMGYLSHWCDRTVSPDDIWVYEVAVGTTIDQDIDYPATQDPLTMIKSLDLSTSFNSVVVILRWGGRGLRWGSLCVFSLPVGLLGLSSLSSVVSMQWSLALGAWGGEAAASTWGETAATGRFPVPCWTWMTIRPCCRLHRRGLFPTSGRSPSCTFPRRTASALVECGGCGV